MVRYSLIIAIADIPIRVEQVAADAFISKFSRQLPSRMGVDTAPYTKPNTSKP